MYSNQFFVSVIIPVYNGEQYLAEAIASILGQNYRPIQVIVVDDGSTDSTQKVVAKFPDEIDYIYQPNSGSPTARNYGLSIARGNVIAFLDADDVWSENKLAIQLGHLANHPKIDLVIGRLQYTRQTEVIDSQSKFEIFTDSQIVLSLSTTLFRKSVFDQVGWFNQNFRYADDWDWFMRAREQGISMMMHPEIVLFAKRHEHNLTNNHQLNNLYTMKMLKKSLERRRQQHDQQIYSLPKLPI